MSDFFYISFSTVLLYLSTEISENKSCVNQTWCLYLRIITFGDTCCLTVPRKVTWIKFLSKSLGGKILH